MFLYKCCRRDSASTKSEEKKSKAKSAFGKLGKKFGKKFSKKSSSSSDILDINEDTEEDYVEMNKKVLQGGLLADFPIHDNQSAQSDFHPRRSSSTKSKSPPNFSSPKKSKTSCHELSSLSPAVPNPSYEETTLKPKPDSTLNSTPRGSTASTILLEDEELKRELQGGENEYHSISEHMNLEDLLVSHTLPQFLRVTRGFYGGDDDESLSDGDMLVAYCVKSRESVLAENTNKTQFSIPLNSLLKFVVAPNGISDFNEMLKLSKSQCATVADLAKLKILPTIVRTTKSHTGESPYESIEANTLLFLMAKAEKEGKVTLIAHDLNGKEYGLREDCAGGFSLEILDTWLFLEEILKQSKLPHNVFIIQDAPQDGSPNVSDRKLSLTTWPLTLVKSEMKKYLIASSDINGEHAFHPEYIMEIPMDMDVEIECVAPERRDHQKALQQASQTVYQQIKMQPGHLIIGDMNSADRELQEELYAAVGDLELLMLERERRTERPLESSSQPQSSDNSPLQVMRRSASVDLLTSEGRDQRRNKPMAPRPKPRQKYLTLNPKSSSLQHINEAGIANSNPYSSRPLPSRPDAEPAVRQSREAKSTRPLPPTPGTHPDDRQTYIFHTPSSKPVTQSTPQLPGLQVYENHSLSQPDPQYSVPPNNASINDASKLPYSSLSLRRCSEPHRAIHSANASPRSLTPNNGPTIESYTWHIPSNLPVAPTDEDIHKKMIDLREQVIMLESRFTSSQASGSSGQSGLLANVGPYKELEKEMARIRTRQVNLEAKVSEYEKRLQKLENVVINSLSPEIQGNLAELRSLTVHQVLLHKTPTQHCSIQLHSIIKCFA